MKSSRRKVAVNNVFVSSLVFLPLLSSGKLLRGEEETAALVGSMSLYDDLGVGASDTKTEGWSKNFKLLQSQLKVKKAALTQAKLEAKFTRKLSTFATRFLMRQTVRNLQLAAKRPAVRRGGSH
ncbi:hypothetical protein ATANTOWER_027868 [Ataeniobius toweri]|uniref:Uncharacterized protein n=1 Tax=Ataeniobius toweri TaxID=208326 RepID=A0ABU7B2P6_9TELE|nr:hypothetical protein [Ataeniobius toweri]